jgi:acyl-CoA synthetase (AMP-forming)/AMP-acid ligase II
VATIGEMLRAAAAAHPEDPPRRLTYAQLDRAADGFAAALVDLGVEPGAVVCLLLPNCVEFPCCYVGAARAGAVTSAVNLRLGAVEQSSIAERTAPAVTVAADGVAVPPGSGTVVRRADLGPLLRRHLDHDRLPPVASTDTACVVWTSGTTGVPKGALYDHVCQEWISRGVGELAAPADRRLFVVPMPHVGYMTRVWDDFAKGVTVVLAGEPWSASRTLRIVESERITMLTGVPTQWQLLLDHPDAATTDWSRVRIAGIGAAAIPPELIRRMRSVLGAPVLARYTSTEAGITTSTGAYDPPEVTATTVGKPSPIVELRVVDPETGTPVAIGAVGEIRCRSRAMFRGYWRDAAATAAAIDDEGFLRTGDLGRIDDDGNLRIVGRLGEMYVRGGYNVYPTEVERVLTQHPAVEQAAVVGRPHPVLGEQGWAFLVVAPGAPEPGLDEVRAWCRERIADYKAPDRVIVVDALPTTAMMKVDKAALVRLAT